MSNATSSAPAKASRKRLSLDERYQRAQAQAEKLAAMRIETDRKARTRELILLGALMAQLAAGNESMKASIRKFAAELRLPVDPLVEAAFVRADRDHAQRQDEERRAAERKAKKDRETGQVPRPAVAISPAPGQASVPSRI